MAVPTPSSTWTLPLARVEVQCAQRGLLDQFALGGDHDYRLNLARYNGEASMADYILDVYDGAQLLIKLKLHDLLSRPDDTVSIEQRTRRINISVRTETHCLIILDFTNDRDFDLFAALLQRYGFKLKAQASERLSFITPIYGATSLGASQSGRSSPSRESWSPAVHDGHPHNAQLVPYMPQLNPYNVYSGKAVADPYRPRQSSPLRRDISNLSKQSIATPNQIDGGASQHTVNPSLDLIRAASFNSYSQSQHTQQTDLSVGLAPSSHLNDISLSNPTDVTDTSQHSLESQSSSTYKADTKAAFSSMLPQQRLLPFKDSRRKRSTASLASDSDAETIPDRHPGKRRKATPKLLSTKESLRNSHTKFLVKGTAKTPTAKAAIPEARSEAWVKTPASPERLFATTASGPRTAASAHSRRKMTRKSPPRATLFQAGGTPHSSPAYSTRSKSLIVALKAPPLSENFSTLNTKVRTSKSAAKETPKAEPGIVEKGTRKLQESLVKSPTNNRVKNVSRRKAPLPSAGKSTLESHGSKVVDEAQADPKDPAVSAVLRPAGHRVNSLRSARGRDLPQPLTDDPEKPLTKRRVATPKRKTDAPRLINEPEEPKSKTLPATTTSEQAITPVDPPEEAALVSGRQAESLALVSLKNRRRGIQSKDVRIDAHYSMHLPTSSSRQMTLSQRKFSSGLGLPSQLPRLEPYLVTESMLTKLHQMENRILDQYQEDMRRGLDKKTLIRYYGHHLIRSRSDFWYHNLVTSDRPMGGVLL